MCDNPRDTFMAKVAADDIASFWRAQGQSRDQMLEIVEAMVRSTRGWQDEDYFDDLRRHVRRPSDEGTC